MKTALLAVAPLVGISPRTYRVACRLRLSSPVAPPQRCSSFALRWQPRLPAQSPKPWPWSPPSCRAYSSHPSNKGLGDKIPESVSTSDHGKAQTSDKLAFAQDPAPSPAATVSDVQATIERLVKNKKADVASPTPTAAADTVPRDIWQQLADWMDKAEQASGISDRQIVLLRKRINEIESELLPKAKTKVDEMRARYYELVQKRSETQRDENQLLSRKHEWTPRDLELFTRLYHEDHTLDTAVTAAEAAVSDAEQERERLEKRLLSTIRNCHHEEHAREVTIRAKSTWWTQLLVLSNILILCLHFAIEPWRRNRLAMAVDQQVALRSDAKLDERLHHALRDERALVESVVKKVIREERARVAPISVAARAADDDMMTSEPAKLNKAGSVPEPVFLKETWAEAWSRRLEFMATPELWRPAIQDILGPRVVWLTMRDLSEMVAEAVATSVVITGVVVWWLSKS